MISPLVPKKIVNFGFSLVLSHEDPPGDLFSHGRGEAEPSFGWRQPEVKMGPWGLDPRDKIKKLSKIWRDDEICL